MQSECSVESLHDAGSFESKGAFNWRATVRTTATSLALLALAACSGGGGGGGDDSIGGEDDDGPPIANFIASPISGETPLDVTFTNTSTGGPATDFAWTFGDGTGSTAQNPTHTYTETGTYTVSLTVTGPFGSDIEIKQDLIRVNDPPDLENGSTVTYLETARPPVDQFILRGTIPVPPGTFPRGDGQVPFIIKDYDGTLLSTQVEIVSLYPKVSDGADVVEVLAMVNADPNKDPGDRVYYAVVLSPHDPPPLPGSQGIDDLQDGPVSVPTVVRNLLADPTSIEIRATDCFGNKYNTFPLNESSGWQQLTRYGPTQTQLKVYESMVPDPPVSGPQGTLPHLLGVHSYLSTFREHEIIGMDLRFHNAHAGNRSQTDLDDPLDKVYFKEIEVVLPAGWKLQQAFEDPYFGGSYDEGDRVVYPIVRPISSGSMHVMRWQSQFHRRLTISTQEFRGRARNILNQSGYGFARRGTDDDEGHEYWSWWNESTARYYPQNFLVPSLTHVGNNNMRNAVRAEMEDVEGHLISGDGDGVYPFEAAVMGWGHPYGVAYGGMTGGPEIFMYDGLMTLSSAAHKGIRKFMGIHRMHTDRQPNALYNHDGEPSSVETWLVEQNGHNDYVPFEHYIVPVLGGNDPFGFDEAPQFQIQHVEGTGLTPWYESSHMFFDPHDYQHFVRYCRSAMVLAWLANDTLAKDDLRLQAEMYNLSYHQYKNSQYGNVQGTGLRGAMNYIANTPASGFPYGRGEAWGLQAAVSAYALSSVQWRVAKRPWLDKIVETISDGQGACNGFIQSNIHTKFVEGKYRARQGIEQAITENALRGLLTTVYQDNAPGYQAMLEDILQDSLYAFISEMAWFPGESAPWTYTGIAPLNFNEPIWCTMAEMPNDAWTANYENYQNWCSFAWGYTHTGDTYFLDKALIQRGGNDLLHGLELNGTDNLGNRAALIALMQKLNGDL